MRLLQLPGVSAALLVLLLVGLWQAVFLAAGPLAIASPGATLAYLVQQARDGGLWLHVWATGQAFLLALVIAIAGGLLLGLLTGLGAAAADTAEPLLMAINAIPKIALYPVVLLLFGIGLPAKVAFGAIHGIVPVAIFTLNASRGVPPALLKTAAVLRLSPGDRIRSILLPSALPDVITGVRLGFSLTLIGTVLGEMFGAQSGLGYLLMTSIGLQNTQAIMGVTVLLIAFAAAVSTALLTWEKRLRRARGL